MLFRSYLAAFKRRRDQLSYHGRVLVSGPGAGEANRVTILNRMAVVNMLTYAPGDAACCPTRASVRRYQLTTSGIALVRGDTASERKTKAR